MDPNSFSFAGMNWLGLVVALVANVAIGIVWYAKWSPTGRIWMRSQGMDPDTLAPPPTKVMVMSMLLMIVGAFFMMFVFTHNFWVYQDAYRNEKTGGSMGNHLQPMDGVMGGLFTWLGFIVPLHFNQIAFERKSWQLFWVNAGYYLVTLVVAGLILATVGSFGNP